MSDYVVGELIRVSASFVNAAGAAADPSVVGLKYKNSEGTQVNLVYGTDVALVKDSVGHYHADLDANQAGTWKWYFYSTGTGQAADKGSFTVEEEFA